MKWQCALSRERMQCKRCFWLEYVVVLCIIVLAPNQVLHAQTSFKGQSEKEANEKPSVEQPMVASSARSSRTVELTLEAAIRLALQQNLNVQREQLSPQVALALVEQERSEFDPIVGLSIGLSQTKLLPVDQVTIANEDTGEVAESVIIEQFSKDGELIPRLEQKILTGGNYELSFVNTRSNIAPAGFGATRRIEDPRYESSLVLTFIQPLLRDFGIAVNTSFIRQGQKNVEIAQQQVLQTVLDLIFAVQQSYWELVFRFRDLEARREALKLAEDFLADNQKRVELKVLAPVELVQAETQVKFREGDVITAEAAVETADDQLKEILNIPETERTWQLQIRPTSEPPFVVLDQVDVEKQVDLAFANRPDLLQSQLDIDAREIGQDFARNQLLPRVDIVGQGSMQAFGGGFEESSRSLKDFKGYQWFIGMEFQYPLSNRFARNRLQQQNLELKQARLNQRILKLVIGRQVRQAVRDISTSSQRVEVTRAATKLAQIQLQTEQAKFRVGLSTSFQVLDFQDELTQARIDEIRTLIDYNVDLASLDQLTGTLRYGDIASSTMKQRPY